MKPWIWKAAGTLALAAAMVMAPRTAGQDAPGFPSAPLPPKNGPLQKALLLLRAGRTAEARKELEAQRAQRPTDPGILYQIARSYLMDFYSEQDPGRKTALALAMESLDSTLKRNPDHIPAMRAKAVIHARAELLYYNPNLAYDLASRVAKLEPHANAFLLNLSEWMSGEVRFTHEGGHRVPQDPLIGLDRSIDLLEQVIDGAMPYSNEETAAFFLMGNTLSRRGNFREALDYYQQTLQSNPSLDQKMQVLREMGAGYYRLGDYIEAARKFYEAMQWRMNSVDQWLFKVSLDRIPPPLPTTNLFPVEALKIDSANPPLLAFEDIAPQLGIHHLNGNGTAAWGDIDGDGDLDLIVSGSGTFIRVYRNDGDSFTDVTAGVGLASVPSGDYLNGGALAIEVCRQLHVNGRSIFGFIEDAINPPFLRSVSRQDGADPIGFGNGNFQFRQFVGEGMSKQVRRQLNYCSVHRLEQYPVQEKSNQRVEHSCIRMRPSAFTSISIRDEEQVHPVIGVGGVEVRELRRAPI